MAQRLVINRICPLCGNQVDEVPDHALKRNGDQYDAEFVQTKRGVKQYCHTTCWNAMIQKQRETKATEKEHAHI